MPNLYVNSVSGVDAADRGDDVAAALRSLTFAVTEAARRFGADRTTIHLAAGLYSAESGEVFPIEMAQNISVIGAGQTSTIIRVERRLTEEFVTALSGGEELAQFTLQGHPVDPTSCAPLTAIIQTLGATSVHDVTIGAAPGTPPGEEAFGRGLVLGNVADVQRVTIRRCHDGIVFGGGDARVADCTLSGNADAVVAIGRGSLTSCILSANHTGVQARVGSGAVISGNRVERNTLGVLVTQGIGAGAGDAVPVISDNHFDSNEHGIVCFANADVVNNDVVTDHHQTGLLAGTTFPAGLPFRDAPVARPVFRNNRVSRRGAEDRSIRAAPLAIFGSTSAPIVEGNRFWVVEGWALPLVQVHHDAVPDLGGGDGGSTGGNRFESGWLLFVQDAASPHKEVDAHNNWWRAVPPRRGANVYVPGDWYVDPSARRDTVVLRTPGAREL